MGQEKCPGEGYRVSAVLPKGEGWGLAGPVSSQASIREESLLCSAHPLHSDPAMLASSQASHSLSMLQPHEPGPCLPLGQEKPSPQVHVHRLALSPPLSLCLHFTFSSRKSFPLFKLQLLPQHSLFPLSFTFLQNIYISWFIYCLPLSPHM